MSADHTGSVVVEPTLQGSKNLGIRSCIFLSPIKNKWYPKRILKESILSYKHKTCLAIPDNPGCFEHHCLCVHNTPQATMLKSTWTHEPSFHIADSWSIYQQSIRLQKYDQYQCRCSKHMINIRTKLTVYPEIFFQIREWQWHDMTMTKKNWGWGKYFCL